MLEQRQRSRLGARVGEDRVDQAILQAQAGTPRGLLDRLTQPFLAHRTHQHLPRPDELRELAVRGATPVEVVAHRHDHHGPPAGHRRGVQQHREQRPALVVVATQREDLLELIDDDHDPLGARTLGERKLDAQMQRPLVAGQIVQRGLHGSARAKPRNPRRERGQRLGAGPQHEHAGLIRRAAAD